MTPPEKGSFVIAGANHVYLIISHANREIETTLFSFKKINGQNMAI